MSITAETCKEHAKDPAVLCCRAEAGITIGPENLEDPTIFDDLVDSGLLNLDGCLTIEQILGAKLTKTCDSLTPVTADVIDAVQVEAAPAEEVVEETAAPVAAVLYHFGDIPSTVEAFRQAHDKRCAHGFFIHKAFVEPAMFTHIEALVGSVDNECIIQ